MCVRNVTRRSFQDRHRRGVEARGAVYVHTGHEQAWLTGSIPLILAKARCSSNLTLPVHKSPAQELKDTVPTRPARSCMPGAEEAEVFVQSMPPVFREK